MAGRPSGKRTLRVWMNGEAVGNWLFGGSAGHSFSYDASWLASPNARPISLSLPLVQGTDSFTGDIVENYFDNLLPDSIDIRKRVASKFAAGSTRTFDILEKIGRDCVGAIMLLRQGEEPHDIRKIEARQLSESQVESLLDGMLSMSGSDYSDDDELRISLAGAQEKFALLWHEEQWCRPVGATPTTHILKLPLGQVGRSRADFSTSVENEWLCSRIMMAYGLSAAESEICRFGRYKVLSVKRFDRLPLSTWYARLPQEDFCQVLGYPSEAKYENKGGPGMAAILDKLRGSMQAKVDRENFLATQLLFWILAAPDGHAKKFSIFLERNGGFQLTPLYDVLSAWPVIGDGSGQFQWQKVAMAMAVRGTNAHYKMSEIQRRHWSAVAKHNAVGSDFEEVIMNFIAKTPAVLAHVSSQLPVEFPAHVSDPIFEGILRQVRALERQA